jgi:hypothetical protein
MLDAVRFSMERVDEDDDVELVGAGTGVNIEDIDESAPVDAPSAPPATRPRVPWKIELMNLIVYTGMLVGLDQAFALMVTRLGPLPLLTLLTLLPFLPHLHPLPLLPL